MVVLGRHCWTWADVEAIRSRWEPWVDEHIVLDALADVDENLAAAMSYVDHHSSRPPGVPG